MSLWVLDPFGGGIETGNIGAYGKVESNITLEAVLEAKKYLERNGEKTIITRTTDEYVSVDKRIDIINHSQSEVLVIFRMNSSDDINIKGVKVAYVNRSNDMKYLAELIKSEIQSELNTIDCGIINESNLYKNINCNAIIVYGEYISNNIVMENFDSKKYGYMVAKACLAYKDKVILTTERSVPKKMQKRAYRVCIGYYNEYDCAMDRVLKLNKEGIKDAYVVPYDGN
ncbi:MAG: N-acetylmuramoyl-L-alanine amidase [Clostridium sp.]|nr:N-acetylmuramoyl-L-alanine amidase [Clostridium sp.]